MEDISTKTIVIAVNIFVTIGIVSIVVIMFFQMQDIYGVVYSTDNAISGQFDDLYTMYNGRVVTGIGLLNAIKKYEDVTEGSIVIEYPGSSYIKQAAKDSDTREVTYLKNLMKDGTSHRGYIYKYEYKYNVTVINLDDGNTKIKFTKIS